MLIICSLFIAWTAFTIYAEYKYIKANKYSIEHAKKIAGLHDHGTSLDERKIYPYTKDDLGLK